MSLKKVTKFKKGETRKKGKFKRNARKGRKAGKLKGIRGKIIIMDDYQGVIKPGYSAPRCVIRPGNYLFMDIIVNCCSHNISNCVSSVQIISLKDYISFIYHSAQNSSFFILIRISKRGVSEQE